MKFLGQKKADALFNFVLRKPFGFIFSWVFPTAGSIIAFLSVSGILPYWCANFSLLAYPEIIATYSSYNTELVFAVLKTFEGWLMLLYRTTMCFSMAISTPGENEEC